jgi:hypothetical protein
MLTALRLTARSWFRVLHFSVQSDHVHLLLEADDKVCLSRGTAGVCIRLSRAINRAIGRRGSVWADRYHARALRTPREVRSGIVYVLMNWKKHVPRARGFDVCSSAPWFHGWARPPFSEPPFDEPEGSPVEAPKTWLFRTGWKRYGAIEASERPKAT